MVEALNTPVSEVYAMTTEHDSELTRRAAIEKLALYSA